ncbi:unnamed protein product [Adineta ricciae]|uniref:V-SNARE coiled-coil homology domain-containing protein n=1 Tax=Adineta ricciae TaxID=249248 RepID=A0A814K5Y6_ADIRI|nr:unnamed protein product [Adineta ricciae]
MLRIDSRLLTFFISTTNNPGAPPTTAGGGGGSKRLAQQQAQVDEVVDIMRQNVDKVLERDKNLSLLDDRADKLQHNAAQFEQHAGKLKRKYWWKNMKMMIIMGVVGIIFTIVVIAWIASKVKAVTPDLPSGDVTTSAPSVNDLSVKVAGGSMGISSGDSKALPNKHRGTRKKTSTTAATIVDASVATAASSVKDDDGKSNADDVTKRAMKRVIRAILNRQ